MPIQISGGRDYPSTEYEDRPVYGDGCGDSTLSDQKDDLQMLYQANVTNYNHLDWPYTSGKGPDRHLSDSTGDG